MFKIDFKYYKSKNPPPSLENVLNFQLPQNLIENKVKSINVENMETKFFGLKPITNWNIFELVDHPGFIFISNPFTSLGQRYWIARSLKDYSKSPNKTNLDIHNVLPETEYWWDYCQRKTGTNLSKKLRWATLGYHHNWDTKEYSEDSKSIFPADLGLLCTYFTDVLNFKKFKAEAAIVNYYHLDSTLSGHTDHSEQNLEAPLLSFSFGQTAVFLLGGKTIDAKPTAMFLQSGDVVIMSKEARLSYHGVPRILKCNNMCWNMTCEENEQHENFDKNVIYMCNDQILWKPFNEYLECARININIRQVLYEGGLKLT